VLEEIKFEDSLKELSENRQRIVENQEEIKKDLRHLIAVAPKVRKALLSIVS